MYYNKNETSRFYFKTRWVENKSYKYKYQEVTSTKSSLDSLKMQIFKAEEKHIFTVINV